MAVSGVRSSWETEEMNSFFIFSVFSSSSAMKLIVSQRTPSSSSETRAIRLFKSPEAICRAAAPISRTGRTMLWMKKRPETSTSASTARAAKAIVSTMLRMASSTRSRETTNRMAENSELMGVTSLVTAITFSPLSILPM